MFIVVIFQANFWCLSCNHELLLYTWIIKHYEYKESPFSSHSILLEMAGIPITPNGNSCLDVGCASGYLSSKLASKGWSVIGIDPELSSTHPDDGSNPKFLRTGIFDFSDGTYALIIAGDVIEHLEDGKGALLKLSSLLEPGGKLLISIPNAVNIYVRLHILFGKFNYQEKGPLDKTHLRFYTQTTFSKLLQQTGFEIKQKKVTPLPAFMILDKKNRIVSRFTMSILLLLAKSMPRVFAYQFIYEVISREQVTGKK